MGGWELAVRDISPAHMHGLSSNRLRVPNTTPVGLNNAGDLPYVVCGEHTSGMVTFIMSVRTDEKKVDDTRERGVWWSDSPT